jgi:ketosteroid isomerase-like protein
MSQQNVEIVRTLAGMFQRRDHQGAFDFYDSAIEWDGTGMRDVYPDAAGIWRGHDGVRKFWQRWLSAWKDLQFDVQDIRDAGDEVVLMIHNQRQWGRHSGILTEFPSYAMVFTFRDAKVVRWRIYADQDAALEAVGLSE